VSNILNKKKRIDQILFDKKFVESRSKGQALIMSGKVLVNDCKVKKAGELYTEDIRIKIIDTNNWVSRGALKIEPIIIKNKIQVDNKICLDIGSSTGGFTEVLLRYKAKKVYAVDVGYGQIHEKIKFNKKVISLERKNARYLTKEEIKERIDILVCDASFISLKKILEKPLSFLKKNGILIGLIKPQFEAKRKDIKKGGIVIEDSVHRYVCKDIKEWVETQNLKVLSIQKSSLKGAKGNKEYFIIATKLI